MKQEHIADLLQLICIYFDVLTAKLLRPLYKQDNINAMCETDIWLKSRIIFFKCDHIIKMCRSCPFDCVRNILKYPISLRS